MFWTHSSNETMWSKHCFSDSDPTISNIMLFLISVSKLNCVLNLHLRHSIPFSIQLLICCLQFLLWKQNSLVPRLSVGGERKSLKSTVRACA